MMESSRNRLHGCGFRGNSAEMRDRIVSDTVKPGVWRDKR